MKIFWFLNNFAMVIEFSRKFAQKLSKLRSLHLSEWERSHVKQARLLKPQSKIDFWVFESAKIYIFHFLENFYKFGEVLILIS